MIFIFDHIIATIIVATLFLSLASTQLRIQEAGVAQVSSHAAKTKALTFGQWLDDDIVSLGENVIDDGARFDNPAVDSFEVKRCESGSVVDEYVRYTTQWTFYSDRLNAGFKERQATRYTLVQQPDLHTVTLDACGGVEYDRPLFQLERRVSTWNTVDASDNATFTSGDFTEDGRSVSTLSLFHIQLLNNQGIGFAAADPVAPDQASYIRVDFSMVPEFELNRGYLRELYWTTTLKVRPFWS